MLTVIDPVALPALRIAATIFPIINLLGDAYIFRNRQRFFGKDPNISEDIEPVRKLRVKVVLIPWTVLTPFLFIVLIYFWMQ